jgi:hypothetical protein
MNMQRLTFGGTGRRIFGDLDNATAALRLLAQGVTVNGVSRFGVIPNGTATTAEMYALNASSATNSSKASLAITATEARVQSAIEGAGSYLPLTIWTSALERARFHVGGNFSLGASSDTGQKLQVTGTAIVSDSTFNPTIAGLQGAFKTSGSFGGAVTLVEGTTGFGIFANAGELWFYSNQAAASTPNSALAFKVTTARQLEVKNRNDAVQRVGWHPAQVSGGTRTLTTADIGQTIYANGGETFTLANIGSNGDMIQIVNASASSITIAVGAVALSWLKGGSASAGSRTVARESVVTLYNVNGTNWTIWGNGIS